jgi:hypothetical protein
MRRGAQKFGWIIFLILILGTLRGWGEEGRFTSLTVEERLGIRLDLSAVPAGFNLPRTGLILGLSGDVLTLGGNVTIREMTGLAPNLDRAWREPGVGEEPGKLTGIYFYLITAFVDDKEALQQGPLVAWTERPEIYVITWSVPEILRNVVRLGATAGYRVYRYDYGPLLLAVLELILRGEIEFPPFSDYHLVRKYVLSGDEYVIRFEDDGRLPEGPAPNLTPTGTLTVEGPTRLEASLEVLGLTAMGPARSWSARLNLAPLEVKQGRPLLLSFDDSSAGAGVWSWAIHPAGAQLKIPAPEKTSPPTVVSFVERFPAEEGWTTVSRLEFAGPAGNVMVNLGNPVPPLGPGNAGLFTVTDLGLAKGGATRLALGVGGTDVQIAIGTPEVPLGIGQPYVPASAGRFMITDFSAATPRLFIDQAGNLGVGTGSPAYRLHIADLGAGSPASLALDSTGLPQGRIWTITSTTTGELVIELAGAKPGAFCNGAPRLEMSPSGAFSLGLPVPATPPGSLTIAHSLGVGVNAPAGCGDAAFAGNVVVGGQLQLGSFSTPPQPIGPGAVYYDSNQNSPFVYIPGTGWSPLSPPLLAPILVNILINNPVFITNIINILITNVTFVQNILNIISTNITFQETFINLLIQNIDFRTAIINMLITNIEFRTEIVNMLVTIIVNDEGFRRTLTTVLQDPELIKAITDQITSQLANLYVQKAGDTMTGTLKVPELEAVGQVFADWLVVGESGFQNAWSFINPDNGPDLALGPVDPTNLAKLNTTVIEFHRATGLVTVTNDLEVGKGLTVFGAAELTGDVLVGGKLDTLGLLTARTARVTDTLRVDGATTLAADASVGQHLKVGGDADILGALTVADKAELMSTLQVSSWMKSDSFAFAKWLVIGQASGNLANSWGIVRTPGDGAGTLTIGAFVTAAEAEQGKIHVPVLSMTSASMTANWPTTFLRGVTVGREEAPANLVVYGNLTVSGIKFFAQEYPGDPGKVIAYASLEGPEAGTYIRGTAQLHDGVAVIELPEHFALVTSEEGLTAQVTPLEECNGLYVAEKSPQRIVVRELLGGKSNARFDYLVQGVRKGYEGLSPVRANTEVTP